MLILCDSALSDLHQSMVCLTDNGISSVQISISGCGSKLMVDGRLLWTAALASMFSWTASATQDTSFRLTAKTVLLSSSRQLCHSSNATVDRSGCTCCLLRLNHVQLSSAASYVQSSRSLGLGAGWDTHPGGMHVQATLVRQSTCASSCTSPVDEPDGHPVPTLVLWQGQDFSSKLWPTELQSDYQRVAEAMWQCVCSMCDLLRQLAVLLNPDITLCSHSARLSAAVEAIIRTVQGPKVCQNSSLRQASASPDGCPTIVDRTCRHTDIESELQDH